MKLILFVVRLVLSLRYRVKLTGVENLKHNGPILLFPNHVALVDPRILIAFLGKYIIASPVASEKYYKLPVLKQAMDLVGTVPIGEMEAGASAEDVKKVFGSIVSGLKEGKNILIYPSGQIYRQDFESIKGKQSAYYIVNNMPENTKILGLRSRGLWGSIWSKAWDNGETTFIKAYIKSIYHVFANLIFFVPKRDVSIEIFDLTKDLKIQGKKSLNEFNKYLEDFYNTLPKEELKYLKHFFYYDDVKNRKEPEIITGSIKELSRINTYDLSLVPENIKEKIIEKIALIKGLNCHHGNNTNQETKTPYPPLSMGQVDSGSSPEGHKYINDNSSLILDLYFDSLDLAEIKSYIQANIPGASNPPITDLKTIGDLYMMAIGKSTNIEKLKECTWGENKIEITNLFEKLNY